MFGLMEPHRARASLTTRKGRAQHTLLSPPTPTPARTKIKGGRRPVIVAGEGGVDGTRIALWGGVGGVGGMATAVVTVARAVEAEAGAPQGGVGMSIRPGGRTTTRKALRELGSRPETL